MNCESTVDLDVRYRPKTLDEVVGQPEAVAVVRSWGKSVPRSVLFHGPSGTSKTTLARIIASDLGVGGFGDLNEVNCGEIKQPIEWVRDLADQVTASPLNGEKRMWILDEVQVWSRAKGAQEALLRIMEFSQPHVIFVLCTTHPDRVIPALRSRCVKVALKAIRHDDLMKLITRIAKAEGVEVDSKLVDKIAEVAAGSARDAVKELQKVIRISDPKERLVAVGGVGLVKSVEDLIRELLPFSGSPNWGGVAKVLEDLKDENPESIRLRILAVARGMMLKGGKAAQSGYRAACCFDKPFFDADGHAMLAVSCYEVVHKT